MRDGYIVVDFNEAKLGKTAWTVGWDLRDNGGWEPRDCGHLHRTSDAAVRCRRRIFGSHGTTAVRRIRLIPVMRHVRYDEIDITEGSTK